MRENRTRAFVKKEREESEKHSSGSVQRMVGRLVVAYGGGVNSTAMLVELHRRSIMPDLILFADTGGERPETYATVKAVSAWCVDRGLPEIVTVRGSGKTLEQDCLDRNALPSIAYGFKTCSQRWKLQPQTKYLNGWKEKGEKYRKAIGFDAGEERRMRDGDDPNCLNWYPLIEWNLWRDDCEAICRSEGLPTAKSSCFFCPSMKKHEIFALKKEHPDLAARALVMEAQAELITVNGLGRNYAWRDLLKNDEDQLKLFSDAGAPEIPCGCYDG